MTVTKLKNLNWSAISVTVSLLVMVFAAGGVWQEMKSVNEQVVALKADVAGVDTAVVMLDDKVDGAILRGTEERTEHRGECKTTRALLDAHTTYHERMGP